MSTDNKRPAEPLRHGFPPLPPGSQDPLDVPAAVSRAIPAASHDSDVPDFDEDESQPGVPIPAPSPDPRELAKRLADEARQRAAAKATTDPAPAAPAKKSSLADRAPRRSDPVAVKMAPPPEPERPPEPVRAAAPRPVAAPSAPAEPQKKKSLADRAGKRMTMEEALRAAANEPEPPPPEPVRAATPTRAPSSTPAPTAAPAATATAPMRPTVTAESVINKVFAGSEIKRAVVVSNPLVFRALWTAHRARAAATADVALMVAAACLLDAVDRVPAGCLSGAHIVYRGEDITVWVDTARGAVLSATPLPDLYLAGL